MALLGSMATTAVLLAPAPAFAAELEAHAEPVPPMPPMHADPAYAEPALALAEPALAAQIRADPRMLAILASPALGGIHAPAQAEPVHAAAASACLRALLLRAHHGAHETIEARMRHACACYL